MADSAIYTVFPHFFFNDTATTEIYTLSLHDALPILRGRAITYRLRSTTTYNTAREKVMENATLRAVRAIRAVHRSEEHTSELQSRQYLVCRLLLEKKKNYPLQNSLIRLVLSRQHQL